MTRACPKCRQMLTLPDPNFDGQVVMCPNCKSRLAVIYGDLKDAPILSEAEEEEKEE